VLLFVDIAVILFFPFNKTTKNVGNLYSLGLVLFYVPVSADSIRAVISLAVTDEILVAGGVFLPVYNFVLY
jgi:hypothetical protein